MYSKIIEPKKDIKRKREHIENEEHGHSLSEELQIEEPQPGKSKTGEPITPFDEGVSEGKKILLKKRKRLENKIIKENSEKIKNLKEKKEKLLEENAKKVEKLKEENELKLSTLKMENELNIKKIDIEIKMIKENEKIILNKITKQIDDELNDFISEINEEMALRKIILNIENNSKGNNQKKA